MGRPTKRQQINKKISESRKGKGTKFNDNTLKKLEKAFFNCCSIVDACIEADIEERTYYNWKKKKPKLFQRIEGGKIKTLTRIKNKIIQNALSGNTQDAKWLLERLKRDEFGNSLDITSDNEKIDSITNIIFDYGEEDKKPKNKTKSKTNRSLQKTS